MRLIILILIILSLSGCFVAPGMRMESVPLNRAARDAITEIQPVFIPINVDLIQSMNRYRYNKYNTYFVGPSDVLYIYVWGHPELNASTTNGVPSTPNADAPSQNLGPSGFLVNAKGYIFYPLVGYINVEGKTVEQIRNKLIRALKKYIRNPQVDVRVIGFRSKKIYVMGEVAKPGLLPLADTPTSLVDAINLAGGLLPDSADPTHIFVIRGSYSRPDVYWLNAHSPSVLPLGERFYLQPQDLVFVPAANITLWNRSISKLLPTVQTVWMTYSIARQMGH